MTDELERQLEEMMQRRVAHLPESYDVEPATLARARRRRAVKLGALGTAMAVVVAGAVAVIGQAVDRSDSHYVSSGVERPAVDTVACPTEGSQRPAGLAPASTQPRVPAAGDPDALSHLVSYAAAQDPRYTVLGPKGWRCSADAGEGRHKLAISSPSPSVEHAGIYMLDDALWHGTGGASLACAASDDPSAIAYLRAHMPALLPCEPDRTYTRVDANVTTFRGPVGVIGASWLRLPSSETADDGRISELTCRPADGVTVAECEAIVADWIARVRDLDKAPVTVPTVTCPVTYAITPDQPLAPPTTEPRTVTVPGADRLASYAATTDPRFVVLGPEGWTCSAQLAADGQDGMSVSRSGSGAGGVSVLNDFLWHGGVGAPVACGVTTDRAVEAYVRAQYPQLVSACDHPGRALTRVDDHVTTFVDRDGTRGASWIVLPSGISVDDGKVSVLTCEPTAGLSAADCDAIVADWIARVRNPTP